MAARAADDAQPLPDDAQPLPDDTPKEKGNHEDPSQEDNSSSQVAVHSPRHSHAASSSQGAIASNIFDVIEYAGAGGRHRGQNRTAEQSFHQTWKSATNAALRRNQISGRPVRVIRGPKCRGPHGTAKSGGGYRYDGLYRVEVAELREMGRRRLKTAMFTLRRI